MMKKTLKRYDTLMKNYVLLLFCLLPTVAIGQGVKPNKHNPVIKGYYADPEIMYSEKTHRYYLYPTTDGCIDWRNHDAHVYSSKNLKRWRREGTVLDLLTDCTWANEKLWAPCAIERDGRTYYYFTAEGSIGVAVADNPAGPFRDALGRPLIKMPDTPPMKNHTIDPDVFRDPVSGKYYLYWGNGCLLVAELADDMVSFRDEMTLYDGTYPGRFIIAPGQKRQYHYNEGPYVFYRNGKYYFTWSENDTRSPEYRVRYMMSSSPTEATEPVSQTIVIEQDSTRQVYGTGHHAILQKPGTDEWYIVYHRFERPDGINRGRAAGYFREVCIDRLYFNEDGTIKPVKPSL